MKCKKEWRELSALLANTSESKHLNVDICLETEEDVGLSTLQKLHMSEIWQHPTEGIITFKLDGYDDEFDLSEYDEFIPQVYEYLKKYGEENDTCPDCCAKVWEGEILHQVRV